MYRMCWANWFSCEKICLHKRVWTPVCKDWDQQFSTQNTNSREAPKIPKYDQWEILCANFSKYTCLQGLGPTREAATVPSLQNFQISPKFVSIIFLWSFHKSWLSQLPHCRLIRSSSSFHKKIFSHPRTFLTSALSKSLLAIPLMTTTEIILKHLEHSESTELQKGFSLFQSESEIENIILGHHSSNGNNPTKTWATKRAIRCQPELKLAKTWTSGEISRFPVTSL